jgi:RNA polymerase sigma factor (TIGR02999 family)
VAPNPESFTALFEAAEGGDRRSADALFAALYSELHRLAARQLARGSPAAALGTTSLLHAAYLDMSGREGASFPDRARFLGYAARVMRGLIIDAARRNRAEKRGGRFEITGLDGNESAESSHNSESAALARLSDALDELAGLEPGLAELVDLKYFCGFTFAEIAALRGVTERTAQRQWDRARLFLHRSLSEAEER